MDRSSRRSEAVEPRGVPEHEWLNDQALFWTALTYAAAADAYVVADPWFAPAPVFELLSRSIELALKAYAVNAGATEDTLRYQIGSDLEACLRYALDHGLVVYNGLREEDRAALRKLSAYCQIKRTGFPELTVDDPPASGVVRGLLNRLLAGVFIPIWDIGTYRAKVDAAATPGLTIDPRAKYRLTETPEHRPPPAVRNEASD